MPDELTAAAHVQLHPYLTGGTSARVGDLEAVWDVAVNHMAHGPGRVIPIVSPVMT